MPPFFVPILCKCSSFWRFTPRVGLKNASARIVAKVWRNNFPRVEREKHAAYGA